jgi:hypothetical protein
MGATTRNFGNLRSVGLYTPRSKKSNVALKPYQESIKTTNRMIQIDTVSRKYRAFFGKKL